MRLSVTLSVTLIFSPIEHFAHCVRVEEGGDGRGQHGVEDPPVQLGGALHCEHIQIRGAHLQAAHARTRGHKSIMMSVCGRCVRE